MSLNEKQERDNEIESKLTYCKTCMSLSRDTHIVYDVKFIYTAQHRKCHNIDKMSEKSIDRKKNLLSLSQLTSHIYYLSK